jgi:hypothetical protein
MNTLLCCIRGDVAPELFHRFENLTFFANKPINSSKTVQTGRSKATINQIVLRFTKKQ